MGNAQGGVEKAWTIVNLRKGETLQARKGNGDFS